MADPVSRTTEVVTDFTLKLSWCDSGAWMLTSDGIKGLTLVMHTFDGMLDELRIMAPELMRLNGQTFPAAKRARKGRLSRPEKRKLKELKEAANRQALESFKA